MYAVRLKTRRWENPRWLGPAAQLGKILRMEIWVDGQKRYSTFGSNTLKTSLALGSGTHQFGYYIVNTAGAKWEAIVYATVP